MKESAAKLSAPAVVGVVDGRRGPGQAMNQQPVESIPVTGESISALADPPQSVIPAQLRLSVVIPCLNEAENIERCVTLAHGVLGDAKIDGEVIVVDNNSIDGSGEIAARAGATVIHEQRPGYGSAYLAGLGAARERCRGCTAMSATPCSPAC